MLHFDTWGQSLGYSFVIITSYMMIIYGNASYLIPTFYQKGHITIYIFASLVLLFISAWYRTGATMWIYNYFYAIKPEVLTAATVIRTVASSLLIYFTSILFYICIHYFRLREQQEVLQRKQVESELSLLKSQVQPHFLFNTLNNIYFYAQRESPQTAALLEKLSSIMRYFVDEAPKEKIALLIEMQFIRNYIDLEKDRMRYPLKITIEEPQYMEAIQLSPMLIIPLVENVFKHGIDKRREDNFIFIRINSTEQYLEVTVQNRLITRESDGKKGTGLNNLQNRLQLLYGEKYSLVTTATTDYYTSVLSLPL
ncbi:MAG: histidine kinase [Chitinophagaceae bacterium]|nr:histidine kinase [Chitinophagaceae bacterium]